MVSLARPLLAAAIACAALPAGAAAADRAGHGFPANGPMHSLGSAAASLTIKNLSSPGPSNGQPQVASLSPKGKTTFAWVSFTGGRFVIRATRLDSAGKKGATKTLSPANRDSSSPAVATAPDGTSTVVWIADSGSNVVQSVRMDARGRTGRIKTLTKPDRNARDASVAVAADGTSTIVWRRDSAVKAEIQALRIDPRGKVGRVRVLSDPAGDGQLPQVASSPNGNSDVIWAHNDGSKWRAQTVRIGRSGGVGPVRTLSEGGFNAYDEGVATTASGTSTFVWTLYTASASLVQVVRRDAKGRFSKVRTLSGPTSSAEQPHIADSGGGTSTIVWRVWNGSVYRVQAARLDQRGRTGAIKTLSAATRYAVYPRVATSPAGRSTVAWQTDNGPRLIQAIAIEASGRLGARRTLTSTASDAIAPQVGASPSGAGSITWRVRKGSSDVIQAVRF